MSDLCTNVIPSQIEDRLTENGENPQKNEKNTLTYSEQSKKINSFLKLDVEINSQLSNTDSALSVEYSRENSHENNDKESDTEDQDSDGEGLYEDDGGFESGDSEGDTEVTIQGPISRLKESHRTTQYHTKPAPEITFLTIVSQKMHEGKDEAEIVDHLEGFIKKIQALPNKQSILHKVICQPEKSGDLEGVHLLTFCAVTDMEKVTVFIVKVILHQCFPTPGHAIPYLRMQDEEGNTILHNIVLIHHQASIHTLKSLLSFRFKTRTNLVFVFNPMILNNLGQHPIHLAMDKPVFRKAIFDIFNSINTDILKMTDNLGNNLLHYLVLNTENITANHDSMEAKVEHMRSYLKSLLSYPQVRDCLAKLNHSGLNAKDVVDTRHDLDPSLVSCLQEELELAVLGLDMPGSPDSGYGAPTSPEVFSWTCTTMRDPLCNATFATSEEVRDHMLQVHGEEDSGVMVDDYALDLESFLNLD